MDKNPESNDAIRRLEELVSQLTARVERLEEELKSQRAARTEPKPPPLPRQPVVSHGQPIPSTPAVAERVSRISETLHSTEPV